MAQSGLERREQIIEILKNSTEPVAGTELAKRLNVSRQVIVQDMALIRANGVEIISTNRGYIIHAPNQVSRVFKVIHTDEQVEEELNLFVDLGAKVENVFVYHKVYNVIKVNMDIKSRLDVCKYMEGITSGKSTNLMNLTSNYHYHTIVAEDEQTLDMIQEELQCRGFLAKLQDYEPIDFWSNKIH
ncbi:MAG: transcription repressor NadR [Faecalimonas sp.]|nr:transcription repressor NadR [Faecalimonas sp.]